MSKAFFFALIAIPWLANAGISCHLHPPVDPKKTESPLPIQGPYPNQEVCDKENMSQYQMRGYCHCGFNNNSMPFFRSPKMQNDNFGIIR